MDFVSNQGQDLPNIQTNTKINHVAFFLEVSVYRYKFNSIKGFVSLRN